MANPILVPCSSVIALLPFFTLFLSSLLIISPCNANSCIKDRRIERELKPCTCESISESWTCKSGIRVDLAEKFSLARLYFARRNVTSYELIINGNLDQRMKIHTFAEGLFDNFIFTHTVAVTNTNLELIHVNAFRTSAASTKYINLQYNNLINSPDPDYDIFSVINSFTSLRVITLQNNYLRYVPSNAFAGLTSLQGVKLSNNHISMIGLHPFLGAPRLSYIGLDSNKLSNLPQDFFSFHNTSAQKLDIDLRMNNLNGNSFPSLESLHRPLKLRLSYNNLTFLDESKFSTFLQSSTDSLIDVGRNHFECGCEMQWLLLRKDQFRYKVNNLKCPGGENIWAWSLQDFSNCVQNDILSLPPIIIP